MDKYVRKAYVGDTYAGTLRQAQPSPVAPAAKRRGPLPGAEDRRLGNQDRFAHGPPFR